MKRFRFYYDRTLKKSSKVTEANGLKYLDNLQAEWQRGLMTAVEAAKLGFDPNNAVSIERTRFQLEVVTTGGHHLCWQVV